jgi:hypothetical protein
MLRAHFLARIDKKKTILCVINNMPDKKTVTTASSWQFVLHHWSSLALLIFALGLFPFLYLAGEVIEGDTMRFDTCCRSGAVI